MSRIISTHLSPVPWAPVPVGAEGVSLWPRHMAPTVLPLVLPTLTEHPCATACCCKIFHAPEGLWKPVSSQVLTELLFLITREDPSLCSHLCRGAWGRRMRDLAQAPKEETALRIRMKNSRLLISILPLPLSIPCTWVGLFRLPQNIRGAVLRQRCVVLSVG